MIWLTVRSFKTKLASLALSALDSSEVFFEQVNSNENLSYRFEWSFFEQVNYNQVVNFVRAFIIYFHSALKSGQ